MGVLTVYGHGQCPMVGPVRQLLNTAGIEYRYVNIHKDEDGRQRVRAINGGNESVPTLVFADETTLSEPTIHSLRDRLQADGYAVSDLSVVIAQIQPFVSVVVGATGGFLIGAMAGDAGTGMVIGTIIGFIVNLLYTNRAGK